MKNLPPVVVLALLCSFTHQLMDLVQYRAIVIDNELAFGVLQIVFWGFALGMFAMLGVALGSWFGQVCRPRRLRRS